MILAAALATGCGKPAAKTDAGVAGAAGAPAGTEWKVKLLTAPGSSSDVRAIERDPSSGKFYVGTAKGLFETQDFQTYQEKTDRNSGFVGLAITALLVEKDGGLWIGTEDGAWNARGGPGFVKYDEGAVRAFVRDSRGTIYMGTSTGFKVLNGQKFASYGRKNSNLPADDVQTLGVDPDGNVLVGTNAGLARVASGGQFDVKTGSAFKPLMSGGVTKEEGNTGMEGNRILALGSGKDGALWIATPVGLNRCRNFQDFALYSAETDVPGQGPNGTIINTKKDGNSPLLSNWIKAIRTDPASGVLNIATKKGLSRYDGQNWKSVTIAEGLPADTVQAIWVSTDEVLIGTPAGLARFAPDASTN